MARVTISNEDLAATLVLLRSGAYKSAEEVLENYVSMDDYHIAEKKYDISNREYRVRISYAVSAWVTYLASSKENALKNAEEDSELYEELLSFVPGTFQALEAVCTYRTGSHE